MLRLFGLLFGLFAFIVSATAGEFTIENYEIAARVDKNKRMAIVEEITVNFLEPKIDRYDLGAVYNYKNLNDSHGIFRTIPLRQISISNLEVSEEYTTKRESSNLTIKIGSPRRTVSGLKKYTLRYTLTMHDPLPQFYYNIIGTDWPAEIKRAAFTITFPESLEAEKVGLSIGKYGTKGFSGGAEFTVAGNVVSGHITAALPPYNGITLRAEVPGGYFNVLPEKRTLFCLLSLIICTILSFVTWFSFGRDAHVTPVVSFYPPPGINSSDAELIINQKSSKRSIPALMIELARDGYISITSHGKENFTLQKLKEYDGDCTDKAILQSALFDISEDSTDKRTLEKSSTFYKRCSVLVKDLNTNRRKFFTKTSIHIFNRIMMFIYMAVTGLICYYVLNNLHFTHESIEIAYTLPFVIFAVPGIFKSKKIALCIRLIIFFLAFTVIIYETVVSIYPENIPLLFTGIICFIINLVCYIQLPRLNFYGQQLRGQLLGLKKFIEVAEKKRLESLVEENPSYFYDILPYAYVLGVSDKWIKQFESITLQPVKWYRGNIRTFSSWSSNVMHTMQPSIANGGISTRTSSSGGGGFSGGGFGGGGGGSW